MHNVEGNKVKNISRLATVNTKAILILSKEQTVKNPQVKNPIPS